MVVFEVERGLEKAPEAYKPVFFAIIDSIVSASRHKYGENDPYADRFAKRMEKTMQTLATMEIRRRVCFVR